MLEIMNLAYVHNIPQKQAAEGSCTAFCLGFAQTKTLNQIEFWWSEDVLDVRRSMKTIVVCSVEFTQIDVCILYKVIRL
jgi:hypothetical protein